MRTAIQPLRYLAFTLAALAFLAPACVFAQTDADMPLGDLARALRRNKGLPAHTVIDNDNISQVMEEVESRKLSGASALFSIDDAGKAFKVSFPDATCSLSFSAQATPLVSDSIVAEELPDGELLKLDGPATIIADQLQISVYNGTAWDLREITVGLTIVRASNSRAAGRSSGKLIPAAAIDETPAASASKPSDQTVLIHLKGDAAPLSTTTFQQSLASPLAPDQEWHWSIIQAKGIPPQPAILP
jgi:hypothetical protein